MRDIVTIATLLAFFVSPSYAGDWKNAVNRATDRAVNSVVNGAIRFADPKGEADASTRRLMQGAGKAFIDPRPSRTDKHWDDMIDAAKDVPPSGATISSHSTGGSYSYSHGNTGSAHNLTVSPGISHASGVRTRTAGRNVDPLLPYKASERRVENRNERKVDSLGFEFE